MDVLFGATDDDGDGVDDFDDRVFPPDKLDWLDTFGETSKLVDTKDFELDLSTVTVDTDEVAITEVCSGTVVVDSNDVFIDWLVTWDATKLGDTENGLEVSFVTAVEDTTATSTVLGGIALDEVFNLTLLNDWLVALDLSLVAFAVIENPTPNTEEELETVTTVDDSVVDVAATALVWFTPSPTELKTADGCMV